MPGSITARPVNVLVRRQSSRPSQPRSSSPASLAPEKLASMEEVGEPERETGLEQVEHIDSSPLSTGGRRVSIVEGKDGAMDIIVEEENDEEPMIFTIFEAANIDGVKHLSSKSRCTR